VVIRNAGTGWQGGTGVRHKLVSVTYVRVLTKVVKKHGESEEWRKERQRVGKGI